MNIKVKKVLSIVAVVAIVIGIMWANIHRRNSTIGGLEVDIEYGACDTMIKAADVHQLVLRKMPLLLNQMVKEVDMHKVLSIVEKSPYLYQCDAHMSVGGNIVIRGVQRRPVVRVFKDTMEFYMDSVGKIIPLSEYKEIDVIVANGDFKSRKGNLKEVSKLATYIDEHEEYKPLFDQIYIKNNGDIYLVPKVGDHVVLLGDLSNLDEKMHNLMVMYHKGMKKTGWNEYVEINLKYNNQVICRKDK